MNNFYSDSFDMVPFERPNLAVEQLAVNQDGDITVEGALSVTGSLVTNESIDVQSVNGLSLIKMRGSGHPSTSDPDAQIWCLNGDPQKPNNGKMTLSAGTGITLNIPNGDLDSYRFQ